jgi:predicted TPR repeat methyltransferase
MIDDYETVGRHFDALASGYDERSAEQWRSNTVFGKMLGCLACAPEFYLDLGAGAGATIREVLDYSSPRRVVAVDASEQMVASLVSLSHRIPNFTAVQAGATTYLETPREAFELVSAISVLAFVEDPNRLLGGVAQRMNRGGWLIFTYNPIVEGSPLLREAQEIVPNKVAGTEVTIHRQHPRAIEQMVADVGLVVARHQLYAPSKTRSDLVAGIVAATVSR